MTIGLYNGYDARQWHEVMRITLARAGPVALGFGCDLAAFGFPFDVARARGAKRTQALRDAGAVAAFVAQGSSIGEGGGHFAELAAAGRFAMLPFPSGGAAPARLGGLVATTPSPDPAKACDAFDVARALAAGEPRLLMFGLGPRGLPPEVLDAAPAHLEATGRRVSLETATALGAVPAQVMAHLRHLEPRAAGGGP